MNLLRFVLTALVLLTLRSFWSAATLCAVNHPEGAEATKTQAAAAILTVLPAYLTLYRTPIQHESKRQPGDIETTSRRQRNHNETASSTQPKQAKTQGIGPILGLRPP